MATVNVKFEDGSQETFNNVPDNITSDQFKQIIKAKYPNKVIVRLEKLKDQSAPVQQPPAQEPYKVEVNGTGGRWVDTGGYLRNLDTGEFRLK